MTKPSITKQYSNDNTIGPMLLSKEVTGGGGKYDSRVLAG